MKPYVLERLRQPSSQNLVAHYPLVYGPMSGAYIYDQSRGGFTVERWAASAISTTKPVLLYPGADCVSADTSFINNLNNTGLGPTIVKTLACWIKPDGVAGADYIIDLNGTDYMTVEIGVLTAKGFSGGTQIKYVDGIVATAVTAKWTHLVITDTTGRDASDFEIGRLNAGYSDVIIADVRLYSSVLTPQQIKSLYDLTKWRFAR